MKTEHLLITLVSLSLSTFVDANERLDITGERLHGAANDASNWLTFGHDYSNQRFSSLDSINTKNVRNLVPKWIFQSGKKVRSRHNLWSPTAPCM